MEYKNGDYVCVRQGNEVLSGILHTDGLVSLAEDENGSVMGMDGPEYVEIEDKGIKKKVKGSDILTPLEVFRLQKQQA